MKVKTPKNSPIAALYNAAKEIVDGTRKVFEQQGQDARELRLPILMHGTDMRVTIEAGPKTAARNAVEHAQMQASGKPVEPTINIGKTIAETIELLNQEAGFVKESHTFADGKWDVEEGQAKAFHDRCLDLAARLKEVERLV